MPRGKVTNAVALAKKLVRRSSLAAATKRRVVAKNKHQRTPEDDEIPTIPSLLYQVPVTDISTQTPRPRDASTQTPRATAKSGGIKAPKTSAVKRHLKPRRAVALSATIEVEVKLRRGRPPGGAVKLNSKAVLPANAAQAQPSPTTKPRGRPRKSAAISATADHLTKPPRGRPKKTARNLSPDITEYAAPALKKQVRRKRKHSEEKPMQPKGRKPKLMMK